MKWRNILIGFASAALFSLLFVIGVFDRIGNQVYDIFLGFRPNRELSSDVVFLDVDDPAIVYTGEFPWPRSIIADSLLRLKEYGARAAVFDIEYIDKGPQGVDITYLNQGLPADFSRSLSEIDSAASGLVNSLRLNRINRNDIDEYSSELSAHIRNELNSLLSRAQNIARDNDQYLIESSALFGRSWATLNLRNEILEGEQAERRAIAEERFSYPVTVKPGTENSTFIDILPTIQGFARAAEGSGYTNVYVDKDGIRRRIHLAQNIQDHWYLQLAFAPLIHHLGNPEIEMSNTRLLVKGAKTPNGEIKDISIPLDGNARMLLDWPKTNYGESYTHLSFYEFAYIENIEANLQYYVRNFSEVYLELFDPFDDSLKRIPIIIGNLSEIFDNLRELKQAALENNSEGLFTDYVNYRSLSRELIREFLDINPADKVNELIPYAIEAFPHLDAGVIKDEADYITLLAGAIEQYLDEYERVSGVIEKTIKDKFCILGRSDTGTTDIGANPFYGEYVNVGTHGVVLDMILQESFITLIRLPYLILFTTAFILLFFISSAKFPPIPRAVSGFLVTVLVIAAAAVLFRYTGIFYNPLLATLSIVSAVIVREIVSYASSEREKQFIRKAFSTYVSDDVVKEIISDPSRLQLGGTKRHMSAIFTDIQGFSTIAEQLDPENLVSLLNRYLTVMSDAVLEENGTIDKYEGDAIIAFFGAPIPTSDHAIRACNAAIAIKRIEQDLNQKIMEEIISPKPLLTRIGINTGNMVAGNMGTAKKMDYTIMGNAVNLAARLEGVNKQYGTWIIASDETINETEGRFLTRKLDRVRVVGINEPVRLHELIEVLENASASQKNMVGTFHEALSLFENQKWKEAADLFKKSKAVADDGVSAKYLERCKAYITKPPKDTWDGVYNLTEK